MKSIKPEFRSLKFNFRGRCFRTIEPMSSVKSGYNSGVGIRSATRLWLSRFGTHANGLISAAAILFLAVVSVSGQDIQHLSTTHPGGMPGLPMMTGIEHTTNGVTVTWDGPSGYYRVYQAGNILNPVWKQVGTPNLTRKQTITGLTSNAFFRVSGPSPQYAGWQVCAECHEDVHDSVVETKHAQAFSSPLFASLGGQTNASCLVCHTVGYGLPTGYDGTANRLYLTGVQCESCHGPAGNHAANEGDLTIRPRVEIAAQVCGGCHDTAQVPSIAAAYHRPNYTEWDQSGHREVLSELKADFADPVRGATTYIPTCGRCHSGTVREAFVEGDPLPDAHEASAVGIACATCHDPHGEFVHVNVLNGLFTNVVAGRMFVVTNNELGPLYTNQIAYPLASVQDYHTTGDFSTNYTEDINVCAQCHNDRGASYTSSRPPHHSPQYNMLLGSFSTTDTGAPTNQRATHSFLEKQCVGCHMQKTDYVNAMQPATAGHTFEMNNYQLCAKCHQSAASAEQLAAGRMANTMSLIQVIKTYYLDAWAVNYAPEPLRTKYGERAWEYSSPGELSGPGPSPSNAEQGMIPDTIKKARFDLYLVQYDGSFGVHNPGYSLSLLMNAASLVQQEFNK